MSDKINGKTIKTTAKFATDELIKGIVAKALGKEDVSDGDASDDDQQFVTVDQLNTFGTQLAKSIGDTVKVQFTEINKTLETLTKSTTDDESDDDVDDDKDGDRKIKKSMKTGDDDQSGQITSVVEKAVKDALKNVGLDSEQPVRKSYVITSDNKLLKNFEGELPDGAVEIDPHNIDADTWDGVPKNIQNNILRDFLGSRIRS